MFENLKGMLGEAYHDDMTAEEVNNFFAGKNFADLSTGNYVDKNKYERDIQNLNNTLKEKETALNSKLTDDEKAAKDREQDKKEIQRLTELLKQNTLSTSKDLAISATTAFKNNLGLKDDDNEYISFINNIVSEDSNKTRSIAKYVAKIANDSYEKGKKDATKDSLGKFGKGKKQDGASDDEDGIGTILAKRSGAQTTKVDYFKR